MKVIVTILLDVPDDASVPGFIGPLVLGRDESMAFIAQLPGDPDPDSRSKVNATQ